MPKMMRAVQVSEAGGAFEPVERELPEPRRGNPHPGRGLRDLSQRCAGEVRRLSSIRIRAFPATRSPVGSRKSAPT